MDVLESNVKTIWKPSSLLPDSCNCLHSCRTSSVHFNKCNYKPGANSRTKSKKDQRSTSHSLGRPLPAGDSLKNLSISSQDWALSHTAIVLQTPKLRQPTFLKNISTAWMVSLAYLKTGGNSSSSDNYILTYSVLGTFQCRACATAVHHGHSGYHTEAAKLFHIFSYLLKWMRISMAKL